MSAFDNLQTYFPVMFFIVFGIVMIVISSFVARYLNSFKPSDGFIACQQTILSAGSMSLAFGIMSYFIQSEEYSDKNKFTNVYYTLAFLVISTLLVCSSIMYKEASKNDIIKNKDVTKVLLASLSVSSVSLVVLAGLVIKKFFKGGQKTGRSRVNTGDGMDDLSNLFSPPPRNAVM